MFLIKVIIMHPGGFGDNSNRKPRQDLSPGQKASIPLRYELASFDNIHLRSEQMGHIPTRGIDSRLTSVNDLDSTFCEDIRLGNFIVAHSTFCDQIRDHCI
jgi:hypothetical protein